MRVAASIAIQLLHCYCLRPRHSGLNVTGPTRLVGRYLLSQCQWSSKNNCYPLCVICGLVPYFTLPTAIKSPNWSDCSNDTIALIHVAVHIFSLTYPFYIGSWCKIVALHRLIHFWILNNAKVQWLHIYHWHCARRDFDSTERVLLKNIWTPLFRLRLRSAKCIVHDWATMLHIFFHIQHCWLLRLEFNGTIWFVS